MEQDIDPKDIPLVYTLNVTINLNDYNPKYPKNPKTFGERIRKKRMDLGLTMKEVSQKLGVSETTIHNWEIKGRKPYRRTEEKLREILGLRKKKVSI